MNADEREEERRNVASRDAKPERTDTRELRENENPAVTEGPALVAGEIPLPQGSDKRSAREVTLLWIPTILGQLEVCGCSAVQEGGLARLATLVRRERAKSPDLLVLSGGNLFTGQDVLSEARADIIALALGAMRVDALHLTGDLLLYGREYLPLLAARSGAPLLSSNLEGFPEGVTVHPVLRREIDGVQVEIHGLIGSTEQVMQTPATLSRLRQVDLIHRSFQPAQYGLSQIAAPEWRARSSPKPTSGAATARVLLLEHFGNSAQAALTADHGFDLVLSTRFPYQEPDPEAIDSEAWNQGRLPDNVYFANWPEGRRVARVRMSVGPQGAEVADYQVLSLSEQYEDDAPVRALIDGLYRRIAREPAFTQAITPPFQDRAVESLPGNAYIGTHACAECHEAEHAQFLTTPHSRSFTPLLANRRELHPDCLSCHSTGLGRPGGYSPQRGADDRAQVGCEVCHGPGLKHRQAPQTPAIRRQMSVEDCMTCHTEDQHPNFHADFEHFLAAVRHHRSADSTPPPPRRDERRPR